MARALIALQLAIHLFAAGAAAEYFYVIPNPRAQTLEVGRVSTLAYHGVSRISMIAKYAATGALAAGVLAAPIPHSGWAGLAFTVFVPDIAHWNAGVLRGKQAFFPSELSTKLRRIPEVKSVTVVRGGDFEKVRGVPLKLVDHEIIVVEAAAPLDAAQFAGSGSPKPEPVGSLAKTHLDVRLVLDGVPTGAVWRVPLADLDRGAPIPEEVAESWRAEIRGADAQEPSTLGRIVKSLPPAAFDRVRLEASIDLAWSGRTTIGTVADDAYLRRALAMTPVRGLAASLGFAARPGVPVAHAKTCLAGARSLGREPTAGD